MRRLAIAVLALGLLVPARAAALGPGSLDRSFGDGGRATARLGPLVEPGESLTVAKDVAVLADGSLLVAGSAPDENSRRALALARFTRSGRQDRSFANDGSVKLQLGGSFSSATALVATDDGGAIVVGEAHSNGAPSLALARFGPEGFPVYSLTYQLGEGTRPGSFGLDVALQSDGRVLVAGSASSGITGMAEPFVARFQAADGAPDLSFGDDGKVIDPAPRDEPGAGCASGAADAAAIVVQPTGTIAAGGTLARTCGGAPAEPFPLLRAYTAIGDPVPAYGTGALGLSSIATLGAGPPGTLVAGGTVREGLTLLPGAARYTSQGALDEDFFPPDGFGALPADGEVTALAMVESTRILAAVDAPGKPDKVVRLLADGSEDPSFAQGALGTIGVHSPRALVVQPSGAVVVAGTAELIVGRETQAFTLTRLIGGTAISRVTVAGSARVRAGAARVKLTCSRGPGCAGVISGRQVGHVAYAVGGGERAIIEVPVDRDTRGGGAAVALQVTNRPARPVRRTVTLD